MANDTENRDQQDKSLPGGETPESRTTLTSDSYLQSGVLDARDRHLDKAHDYHLDQDMGDSAEQVNANLHLRHEENPPESSPDTKRFEAETDSTDLNPAIEMAALEPGVPADPAAGYSTSPLPSEEQSRTPSPSGAVFGGGSSVGPLNPGFTSPIDNTDSTSKSSQSAGQKSDIPQTDSNAQFNRETDAALPEAEDEAVASNLSSVTDIDTDDNTVSEDAETGAATGIQASADVATGTSVQYSLLDDANGLFAIDPDTGIVTVAGDLDAETAGVHEIVVLATASDGATETESFTIKIRDVDEFDVSFIKTTDASGGQFSENVEGGTATGISVLAEDRDVSDTVTYSVDDPRFDIDANGVVTIAEDATFDAETQSNVSFTVTATSSDGSQTTQQFDLKISDANEFSASDVLDTDSSVNSIAEDAVAGAQVGITAFATDADVSDTVNYSVSDDRFEIADDGTVTVAEGASFDAEAESSIDLTITATSTDGSTSEETFTIQVSDVSDTAPTDIQLHGQTGNLIKNGSFEAFDVSNGSWTHAGSDPSGAWSSEGPVEIWDNYGGVKATEGDQHIELDSDHGVNSISQTVETTVGRVYDLSLDAKARTTSATSTVEVYWNGALISAFDPETGDWSTFDFQVVGTGGSDVLEIRETGEDNDSYGALLDNVSLIEVPLTISEGVPGAVVGTVTTTDADATDSHTYAVSDPRFEVVTDGDGNAVLKLKDSLSLDEENAGDIEVTITTTDEAGLSYSENFVISVADLAEKAVGDISDANAATNSILEDAAEGTSVGITVHAEDGNAKDTVIYSVSDPRFQVEADGSVTVASGAKFDFESEPSISLSVTATSSDGSQSSETFEINVGDVSETYHLPSGTTTFVDEGVAETSITGNYTSDTIAAHEDGSKIDGGSGNDTIYGGDGIDTITGGAGNDNIQGGGGDDTFEVGKDHGDDVFDGGAGTDRVIATEDDVEIGLAGNFTAGAVEEIGGNGHDNVEVHGNWQNNTLDFSGTTLTDIDAIDGEGGNDTITGTSQDDTIRGGTGNDTLHGGDGNDTFEVGKDHGDDVFDGGAGTDRVVATEDDVEIGLAGNFTAGAVEEIGGNGHDNVEVHGNWQNNTLDFSGTTLTDIDAIDGEGGNDTITGTSQDDTIRGGTGNDTLHGGDGNDTFEVGKDHGDDVFDGGAGTDRVVATEDDVEIGLAGNFTAGAVEEISGNGHDNVEVHGNWQNNTLDFSGTTLTDIDAIDGEGGNDTITGTSQDDTIRGGTGNDTLHGGDGNDTFEVGKDHGDDVFDGGAGTDRVVATEDDVEIGLAGNFTAGAVEEISGNGHDNVEVHGNWQNNTLDFSGTTLTDIDAIDGEGGNDTITGTNQDDTIRGGTGNDTLRGGDGNDTFEVGKDHGDDVFDGGAGTDRVVATEDDVEIGLAGNFTAGAVEKISGNGHDNVEVHGNWQNNTLDFSGTTLTDIDAIDGEGGNDTITGTGQDDTIRGGTGNDTLHGGDGDDTFEVGKDHGDDVFDGGAGTDRVVATEDDVEIGLAGNFTAGAVEEISGNGHDNVEVHGNWQNNTLDFSGTTLTDIDAIDGEGGNDTITGTSQNDTIRGGTGNDTLYGGDGNDTLEGGSGSDILYGGTGTDTAVFSGNISDYDISQNDDGSLTIADTRSGSPDGSDGVYDIETLRFSDGDLTVSNLFSQAVSDVTDTDASSNAIAENAPEGSTVGITAFADDGNASDSVSYTVSDDRFSVDADGVVTVAAGASFDFETENTVDLTVTATSTDGSTSSQTFSIAVSDIAEDLQLSDGGVSFTDTGTAETAITGGTGNDTITAHEEGSNIDGGAGSDRLIGGSGDDTLAGSEGADLLEGGAGDDTLKLSGETTWSGYAARNTETGDLVSISGKTRNSDVFKGGEGNDTLVGTDQADAIFLDDSFTSRHSDASGARLESIEAVELGAGNDLLDMTSDSHTYTTDVTVDGGTGNDVIWTGDGDDTLEGGEGNDNLFGGAGNDTLDGGTGSDTALYSGNWSDYDITENADGSYTVTDTRAGSPDGSDTVSNVETFSFADGDKAVDELIDTTAEVGPVSDTNSSANTIHETDGAGTQVGITAIASDPDGDAVTYQLSDDRFSIDDEGVVTVADHAFFDSQVESSIDLTVTAKSADGSETSETFSIDVAGNYDYQFTGGTGSGTFSASGQSYSVDGVGGSDNISTGEYNDRIEGGSIAGADVISGNGGRDLLFGEGGQDMIVGGAGDDVIVGGADADNLVGGDGSDLFMYGLGDGNDSITGGTGSAWTDVIDLGGGPGITAAGDYGTDWTVTVTEGSITNTDMENGRLELTEDAYGSIEFADGSKVDFAQIEEIRW